VEHGPYVAREKAEEATKPTTTLACMIANHMKTHIGEHKGAENGKNVIYECILRM
jgi:hypothetical protein